MPADECYKCDSQRAVAAAMVAANAAIDSDDDGLVYLAVAAGMVAGAVMATPAGASTTNCANSAAHGGDV